MSATYGTSSNDTSNSTSHHSLPLFPTRIFPSNSDAEGIPPSQIPLNQSLYHHRISASLSAPFPRSSPPQPSPPSLSSRASSPLNTSPSFLTKNFRYIILLLIPLTPFGGHFFKNSLSSLELYLLSDPLLHMNSTLYGTFVASFSMANLFMPFYGGLYIDKCGHRSGLLLFLSVGLVGVLICIISLYFHHFSGVIFGGILFGAAHGNVVVAQRAVISRYFAEHEITFALGCSVGITCMAKMSARAVVVPVAIWWGGYLGAFWVVLGVCAMSLGAAHIYVWLSRKVLDSEETPKWSSQNQDKSIIEEIDGDEFALGGEMDHSDNNNNNELSLLLPPIPSSSSINSTNSYNSSASASSASASSSTPTKKISTFHRVSSLISIRNILTFSGPHGLGGKRGPVVVPPEGIDESEDIEKNINDDRVKSSLDPLVKMRRERSASDVDKGQQTPQLKSVNFHPQSPNSFTSCCTLSTLTDSLSSLTLPFWLLSILHMLFLLVFHLFPNISGHFLTSRWSMTPSEAGYVSSLLSAFVVVGAPLTGFIIDRTGGQLYVCLAAAAVSLFAYYLLTFTFIEPVYPILLLSLAESCVPTILMALIPLSVDKSSYGFAFGIAEIFDAVGSIAGNILMGYIRDSTQTYRECMIFIIVLNVICIVLVTILIIRDQKKEKVFNVAWHKLALKKKGRGNHVEKRRQRKSFKHKRGRADKRAQRRNFF
ncbi:hypothetical protein TL16_g13179 [Triparma laevis f. inornata]|uniref:Lysosomal dipeptide transporter MFSD1 n=1 Tax=Triparma laevis f. inornata TaxID=1714386 RepID=A0A9W7BW47_9STRA|nr:hypothetical protein TL16_g13179 [Triparma laevis f. inornata]